MPRQLDCQQVLERLEAYVDAELDELTAAAVTAHLESCGGCAAERHLALDVRRELRALPSFDTPPAVLREVFHRVGSERFRTPPRGRRPARAALARPALTRLAAAAAVAVAMIGGGILLSLQTARTPEPASANLAPAAASPEEIARATEEARLAFAQVAKVSRKAGFQVRDDLGEHLVAASTRSLTRALWPVPAPSPAAESKDLRPDRS